MTKVKHTDSDKFLPQIVLLFITIVRRKFCCSPQELSFVRHSLLFVQLLASGENRTKFKADTSLIVTQEKKNKLVCVADFSSPPLCSVLRSSYLKFTVPFNLRRSQHPGENHYSEGVAAHMDLFGKLPGNKAWRMTQIKKDEEESLTNSPSRESCT